MVTLIITVKKRIWMKWVGHMVGMDNSNKQWQARRKEAYGKTKTLMEDQGLGEFENIGRSAFTSRQKGLEAV